MSKIFIALDYSSPSQGAELLFKISDHIDGIKIGYEFFLASGPSIFANCSLPIFFDLKLHDIPETVEKTVELAGNLGVKYLTIHIAERKMLEVAVKKAEQFKEMKLLGVAVLTSISNSELSEFYFKENFVGERIERLTQIAYNIGIQNFICPPQYISLIKNNLPDSFIVSPGIHSLDIAKHAHVEGADILIIGRMIRNSLDPLLTLKEIRKHIE